MYWLFKSEPQVFSWKMLCMLGEKGEPWDGVRNYQARNFMAQMSLGDLGFFYHSQKEKAIVGVVEVISHVHQDPKTDDPRWRCVDVKAHSPFVKPVTLAEIKKIPACQHMVLLRQARLSVQPVTPSEWLAICELGGV